MLSLVVIPYALSTNNLRVDAADASAMVPGPYSRLLEAVKWVGFIADASTVRGRLRSGRATVPMMQATDLRNSVHLAVFGLRAP